MCPRRNRERVHDVRARGSEPIALGPALERRRRAIENGLEAREQLRPHAEAKRRPAMQGNEDARVLVLPERDDRGKYDRDGGRDPRCHACDR